MFYPGDPIEQRKRELIKRLGRSRGGVAGSSGTRIGRAPGFFGRGVGFGAIAAGGSPTHIPQIPSHVQLPSQAGQSAQGGQFDTGSDMMDDFFQPSSPVYAPPNPFISPNPVLPPNVFQQLMQQYQKPINQGYY